jgi:gliding motility-associated-like protein
VSAKFGILAASSLRQLFLGTTVAVVLFLCSHTSTLAQPVFMGFPDDNTVSCDQIPIPIPPMAGSNCLPLLPIALSEHETIGSCPQSKIIKRVWTATDNCGRTVQQTQTITVIDRKSPTITFVRNELIGKKNGDTLTLDCRYAYGLTTADVYVTDNCDNAPSVVFKDNLIRAGHCPTDKYLLFMDCSWIATDACGNSTEVHLYIKFIDVTPPEMWGQPNDITVNCEGQLDFSQQPYFKDFCDGQPTLKEERNVAMQTCAGNYILTRNWIATDICGNTASLTQRITVRDTIAPVIISKPQDITIQFGGLIPPPAVIVAKDNCNQPTIQKLSEQMTIKGCDSLLIRSWEVKDVCGNTATIKQNITILTQKPTTAIIVADSTKFCLYNNKARISSKITTNPVLPKGYKTIYLLSDKNGLVKQIANQPTFEVNNTGDYAIHNLVFDQRFDEKTIKLDSTTLNQLSNLLNDKCAAFDGIGAKTSVKICDIIPKDSACIKPILQNIVTKSPDCDSINGSIEIKVNPSNVNYRWSNNVTNSNQIGNLTAGVYYVTITQASNSQCFIKEAIVLDNKNDYTIVSPSITPTDCAKATGEVAFSDTTFNYRWFDGALTPTKKGLAAGTYYVSVTKNGQSCIKIVTVEVKENASLSANVSILRRPDCAENNGSAKINVIGGSGDYIYSWGTTAQKDNLVAGIYNVTITDVLSGCKSTVSFVLMNDTLPASAIITSVEKNNCAGNLAQLNISVHLSAGASAKIVVIDAQNKLYDPKAIPAGDYFVLIYDNNDCLIGSKAVTVTLPSPLKVEVLIDEALCKGNIQLKVSGGNSPYLFDWADVMGTNNPQNRFGLKPAAYQLTVTDSKGCQVILNPKVSDLTCGDTCINWIPEKNVSIASKDCGAGATWCLPIPISIFKAQISTLMNGKPYSGQVSDCRQSPTDSVVYTQLTLPIGNHIVIFSQKRGKNICHDTVNVQILCDNCPTIYSGALTVTADSCKGSAKICLDVTSQYLNQIKITESGQPYADPITTCASGKAQLILKPRQNDYNFEFNDTLWNCKSSVKIKVRCDTLKDTPVNSLVLEKNLCIGDSFYYCLDTLELNKGPFTVANLCPQTYKAIQYTLNGICVNIKADTLGTESICLYICDNFKRCDTTYIVINVIPKIDSLGGVDTLYREISVGKSDTVCISTNSLSNVDSVYNYCAGVSGKAVKFIQNGNSACIRYEGLQVGLEKGCFIACDNTTGRCDTTIVFVKVKKDSIVDPVDTTKPKLPPVAIKDIAHTILEKSVAIDVLGNDSINGALKLLRVFRQPRNGDAYYTQNGQGKPGITYIPYPNTCGIIDTFHYYIENEHGRDSAAVCIVIECQQLIIFNGVSPNGDNVNDVFTILGIEEHPDNIVTIYNRWGNRIFVRDAYRNDEGWDGTWNGTIIPDGTYFYQVNLPRLQKVFTGYLELRR